MSESKARQIAALNDAFRRTFTGGRVTITRGIAALSQAEQQEIIASVQHFDDFGTGNDPYHEHDFGACDVTGVDEKIFWKIDYYAKVDGRPNFNFGSEDAADPNKTARVLTIMLASEY